jgi:topoisomerase-4 subunit A
MTTNTPSRFAVRAKIENLVTTRRAGKQFVAVGEGDALVAAHRLDPATKELAALSAEGRMLVFPLEEVNELPNGGRGVMAIKLHDQDARLGIQPADAGVRVAAIGRGDKRVTLEVGPRSLEHYRGSRARSGRKLEPYFKRVEGFE